MKTQDLTSFGSVALFEHLGTCIVYGVIWQIYNVFSVLQAIFCKHGVNVYVSVAKSTFFAFFNLECSYGYFKQFQAQNIAALGSEERL